MKTIARVQESIDPFAPARVWRAVTFKDGTIQDSVVNVLDNGLDALRTLLAIEDIAASDLMSTEPSGAQSVIGERYVVLSATKDAPVDVYTGAYVNRWQIRAALLLLKLEAEVQLHENFAQALAQREMEAAQRLQDAENRSLRPGLLVPNGYAPGKVN